MGNAYTRSVSHDEGLHCGVRLGSQRRTVHLMWTQAGERPRLLREAVRSQAWPPGDSVVPILSLLRRVLCGLLFVPVF